MDITLYGSEYPFIQARKRYCEKLHRALYAELGAALHGRLLRLRVPAGLSLPRSPGRLAVPIKMAPLSCLPSYWEIRACLSAPKLIKEVENFEEALP